MGGIISMSVKEVDRIGILERLNKKEIKQHHAAKLVGVSIRQIRRLVKKYKQHGAAGLVHMLRGKARNRGLSKEEKDHMTHLIKTNYTMISDQHLPVRNWQNFMIFIMPMRQYESS